MMRILFIIALFFLVFAGGSALCKYDNAYCRQMSKIIQASNIYFEQESLSRVSKADVSEKDFPVTITGDTNNDFYLLYNVRYQNHADLIDKKGVVKHRWHINFRQAFPNASHILHPVSDSLVSWDKTFLLPNGDLIITFIARGDTPYGYGMAKIDKNSKLIWAYNAHAHHDFYVDPKNGHIFALVHEFLNNPVKGFENLTYPMLTDYIVELSEDGRELQRFNILEAFASSPYAEFLNRKTPYGNAWDHTHTNSITKLEPELAEKFPMFQPGQFLISIRNMDIIAVVDMNTKQIVWASGGPWRAQHDASFLNNGNILLFDNRGHMNGSSRIVEFDPKASRIPWSYGGPNEGISSFAYGQAQRLQTGNTLINSVQERRVFEVDQNHKKVWELTLPAIYGKINAQLPPYTKNSNLPLEEIAPDYNLLTAIISAKAYAPSQLSFLKDDVQ